MIRDAFREALRAQAGRIAWVLWAAMTVSPLLFVGVVWFVVVQNGGGGEGLPEIAETAIMVVATSTLVLSVLLRKYGERPSLLVGASATMVPPGMPAPENEAERRLLGAALRYRVLFLVSLALSEAGAVFGFVLSFMSSDISFVLVFGWASVLVNLAFLRPSGGIYKQLEKAIIRG